MDEFVIGHLEVLRLNLACRRADVSTDGHRPAGACLMSRNGQMIFQSQGPQLTGKEMLKGLVSYAMYFAICIAILALVLHK